LSEAWIRNTADYNWKVVTGINSMIQIRINLLRIRIIRNNLPIFAWSMAFRMFAAVAVSAPGRVAELAVFHRTAATFHLAGGTEK